MIPKLRFSRDLRSVRRFVAALILAMALGVPLSSVSATDSITLHNGANLVSFPSLPDPATLDSVLGAAAGDAIKVTTDGKIAVRDGGGAWIGNLNAFERNRSYWVNVILPADQDVQLLGTLTDPDLLFQLHAGANFPSFPCGGALAIDSAFSPAVEDEINGVMGEAAAGTPGPSGWIGSLNTLRPGEGYIIGFIIDLADMSYTCPGSDGSSPYVYGCIDSFATNYDPSADIEEGSCTYDVPSSWDFSPGAGQAFYLLHDVRVGGVPIDPSADAVAAFVNGASQGYGHSRNGWTTVPALSAPAGFDVTLSVWDASTQTETALVLSSAVQWNDSTVVMMGCTDPAADNYQPVATVDIGNCFFADGDDDDAADDDDSAADDDDDSADDDDDDDDSAADDDDAGADDDDASADDDDSASGSGNSGGCGCAALMPTQRPGTGLLVVLVGMGLVGRRSQR